jgi:hypothetical protein
MTRDNGNNNSPPPKKFTGRAKPGEVRNPNGGPRIPHEVKAIRGLTHADVYEVGTLLLNSKFDELQSIKEDPNTPALKAWMCQVVLKATERGDYFALEAFLNRVIGKPRERTDEDIAPIMKHLQRLKQLSDHELLNMAKNAIKRVEDKKK